jgi:hypothetical protein
MVGVTQRGPLAAKATRSDADLAALFGARDTGGYLHDSAETKFRIGGGEVVVSRVVGPNPVAASINLFDAAGSTAPGDVALVLTAAEVGAWGNGLKPTVTVDGGNFVISVTHDDDGAIATSPALADRAAAAAWAATIDEFDITLGASNEDPRAMAATNLTGGDDDRANITPTQWQEAFDRFLPDFGAGQVLAPGITTDAVLDVVRAHAAAHGDRFAFLDLPDTRDTETLLPLLAALRDNTDGRYGAVWLNWSIIPGLLPGATRTVPRSAVQAGLEARNAANGLTAGEPAAGDLGAHPFVTGLTQDPWTEDELEALNEAGGNVALVKGGAVRTYGYRTLVDPNGPDQGWIDVAHARTNMQIVAAAEEIAERYVFRQIDGKGHVLGEFAGELSGMLAALHAKGALYGETPDEAYVVDVGPGVNTPESLAARIVKAAIAVRFSPTAEFVRIEIVKTPITESLAA